MEHILLLTAPRGAGKTTACWRFVEAAKGEGLQVEGILAPARLDDTGRKVGIDVLDVATGTRRNLAWLEPDESRRTIGPYRFDLEAMAWALDCVLQALDKPGVIVLIDEIGPLELLQGRGFAPALDKLTSAPARVAILVVRAELLAELQGRLADARLTTVGLTLRNRDQIAQRLMREVWTS